jgi:hypothetical protein
MTLLDIHAKECKSAYNGDACTPIFIVTLFIVARLWNQPRCPPIDELMQKIVICTQWSIIQP